jgi:hypothetical protein
MELLIAGGFGNFFATAGCRNEGTRVRITVPMMLLCFALVGESQMVAAQSQSVVKDGDYVGLEKMPNLSPDDHDAKWFHENTLVVRNDEAILDKVPITIRHGEKSYPASDGGFLTYRAKFTKKDGQRVIQMRLFESDYVMFPVGKHDQYTEIKTYPVKFVSDEIEFDGVRYKLSKVEDWKLSRLLGLLSTEPLEASDANLPPITIDSAAADYREATKTVQTLENRSCNGGYRFLEHPTTVADFVGGKVKTIHVLRIGRLGAGAKPVTPDETRQRFKRVWQGKFQVAFCQTPWQEAAFWSMEAVVEFEDGKRSTLITDGVHVALQDHNGNSAFFRLFPAAQ